MKRVAIQRVIIRERGRPRDAERKRSIEWSAFN